jgi:hypothetical protein
MRTTSPVCGALDEAAAAEVDAHVAGAVEEHEVTRLERSSRYMHALPVERLRVVGQRHAHLRE